MYCYQHPGSGTVLRWLTTVFQHTVGMKLSEGEIPDVDPVPLPGVAELFHKGIGIWWVLLVGGVIVAAVGGYVYLSGRIRLDVRVPMTGVAMVVIGVLLIYISYWK